MLAPCPPIVRPCRRVFAPVEPPSAWPLQVESIVYDRRMRRQRNLNQIEIPADHVIISEDVLGQGGFGTVYIADYNGRNAAAKVTTLRVSAGKNNTIVIFPASGVKPVLPPWTNDYIHGFTRVERIPASSLGEAE